VKKLALKFIMFLKRGLEYRRWRGGPTQPPIQWVLGALSPGSKRLGREADHLPPSSAAVKHAGCYTSTPPIRLHGVVLS